MHFDLRSAGPIVKDFPGISLSNELECLMSLNPVRFPLRFRSASASSNRACSPVESELSFSEFQSHTSAETSSDAGTEYSTLIFDRSPSEDSVDEIQVHEISEFTG